MLRLMAMPMVLAVVALAVVALAVVALAVRTAGAASLGAGAQGIVDNRLDGARATAALGAASEASIDLLGVAVKVLRTFDGTSNVAVAKHVAGTNDHLKTMGPIEKVKFR